MFFFLMPSCSAFARAGSTSSPWPMSAVNVTTSQSYVSCSHFRITDVSRPPEYASTTLPMSDMWGSLGSCSPVLVDFQADLLDDGCPLRGLAADQRAEVLRRSADQVEAEALHLLLHVRRLEDRVDLDVQPRDDRLRRVRRDKHAVPRERLEAGVARL